MAVKARLPDVRSEAHMKSASAGAARVFVAIVLFAIALPAFYQQTLGTGGNRVHTSSTSNLRRAGDVASVMDDAQVRLYCGLGGGVQVASARRDGEQLQMDLLGRFAVEE
jgi:hypothetical protein